MSFDVNEYLAEILASIIVYFSLSFCVCSLCDVSTKRCLRYCDHVPVRVPLVIRDPDQSIDLARGKESSATSDPEKVSYCTVLLTQSNAETTE